jgi:hypothetical protein
MIYIFGPSQKPLNCSPRRCMEASSRRQAGKAHSTPTTFKAPFLMCISRQRRILKKVWADSEEQLLQCTRERGSPLYGLMTPRRTHVGRQTCSPANWEKRTILCVCDWVPDLVILHAACLINCRRPGYLTDLFICVAACRFFMRLGYYVCATLYRGKDEEVANLHSRRRRESLPRNWCHRGITFCCMRGDVKFYAPYFMAFDLKIKF